MKDILVVDDDVMMTNVIARALPNYRVTIAHNGAEALARAAGMMSCDLLIADYVMPVMSGEELAGRMRQQCPALKTLLVTGHGTFVDVEASATDAQLNKPFTMDALRKSVARLIGM